MQLWCGKVLVVLLVKIKYKSPNYAWSMEPVQLTGNKNGKQTRHEKPSYEPRRHQRKR